MLSPVQEKILQACCNRRSIIVEMCQTLSSKSRENPNQNILSPVWTSKAPRRTAAATVAGIEPWSSKFMKNVSNVFKSFSFQEKGGREGDTAVNTKPFSSIPGPKGLPFLGSALEYTCIGRFTPKEYHKALMHRHKKYGKIFRERILKEEFVYVSDPDDIRVLVQNEGASPCRPHLEAIVESRNQENLPVGITSMQGDEWLRNRHAINPGISVPEVVKQFKPAQQKVSRDFATYISLKRDKVTGEVPEFDLLLNSWALESIAVVLLDTRLGLLDTDLEGSNPAAWKLRECMDIFFDYGARLTFGMPIWRLWKTRDWKIFCQSQRDEFQYSGYFVKKKLKELGLSTTSTSCPHHEHNASTSCPHHKSHASTSFRRHEDYRQLRRKKGNKKFSCLLDRVMNNNQLSRDEAITVCVELLAGGIDTTATAAIFTMYHLSRNPTHQRHLRELLERESDDTGDYNREKSRFSRHLKACIWESMRLNPLTYANVRTTEKDLILSGYHVPAGTTVRYTSHLMNLQSEEFYKDPQTFRPERWTNRDSPYSCKKQFTFTPFGHGARQCPGRRAAEQELDLLFREILPKFHIGFKYGKLSGKARLFNKADKPAQFDFTPVT